MKTTKIDNKLAREEITKLTQTSRDVIAIFWDEDGTTRVISATEDREFDLLAATIAYSIDDVNATLLSKIKSKKR